MLLGAPFRFFSRNAFSANKSCGKYSKGKEEMKTLDAC